MNSSTSFASTSKRVAIRAYASPAHQRAACAPLLSPSSSYSSSSSSSSSSLSSSSSPFPSSAYLFMPSRRGMSTTAPVCAKPRRGRPLNDPMQLRNMGKFQYDDVPTLGHLILDRQRELLGYARVAQHEMPKLLAMRKAYKPAKKADLLRFRLVHFQGEPHPMTSKAVMTVSVRDLFSHLAQHGGNNKLKSAESRRKFLLLAGARWDVSEAIQRQPDGSAMDVGAAEKEALKRGLGEIKISSERFQQQAQNVKWCSDALDRMIEEASQNPEEYKDVALDLRPTLAREAKRRGFDRRTAPSIKDFPQEWL